jgi:hypothetical protein
MRYLVIIIFVVSIVSCSQKKQENSINSDNYDPIMSPYIAIVEALSQDDFERVSKAGKLLSEANVDNGVMLALVRMGSLIIEASSLYDQRAILEQMGMVMPLYIEQSMLNNYPIYKFNCKNEFDGKVVVWYYVQKNSKNPFIGGNSGECVELVETIDPVIKN